MDDEQYNWVEEQIERFRMMKNSNNCKTTLTCIEWQLKRQLCGQEKDKTAKMEWNWPALYLLSKSASSRAKRLFSELILIGRMLKVNWDFERGITWCPPFLLRPPSLPRPLLPSGNPPFTLMEQMKVIEVPLCRSQLWHKRNPHKNCLHFEIHFRHLRW